MGSSKPTRRTPQIALLATLAGCLFGPASRLLADEVSAPASAPTLRVLLYEGAGPVRVVRLADGAPTHEIQAVDGGLRADGGPVVATWRSGPGPLRARGLRVRGSVAVRRTQRGLAVVNRVGLEDYLVGTLGREMYASWSPAALRAQAVASRSYALHRRGARRAAAWDVVAGTASQVYGGLDAESGAVAAAVAATRGEVLMADGGPILAAFHAASGGRTASAEEVWGQRLDYLVSRPVPGEEDSPDTYWRAAVTRTTLGRALAARGEPVGDLQAVEVVERSPSGRVLRVALRGTRASAVLTGRELRTLLGESTLRSTLFEVRPGKGGWVFVGSGRGHGVGMSQWGAQAMARSGASYREILAAFYPGAQLVTVDGARLAGGSAAYGGIR